MRESSTFAAWLEKKGDKVKPCPKCKFVERSERERERREERREERWWFDERIERRESFDFFLSSKRRYSEIYP